jgi:uncharacterized protein (TIGR02145 family)
MKKHNKIWIYPLILIGFTAIVMTGCKKDDAPETETGIVTGIVADGDSNTYVTVKIGAQTWMLENLKTTKFNDNTVIPEVTNDTLWSVTTNPGYCWYDNNIFYKEPYGALYNWHAVSTGKLAPQGWHVATKEDWEQLLDYLGGHAVAGAKLKEIGTSHWINPNDDATNETGFTAVPNGYRSDHEGPVFDVNYDGKFINVYYRANWWTGTQDVDYPETAWAVDMLWNWNSVGMNNSPKGLGRAIRCVKD